MAERKYRFNIWDFAWGSVGFLIGYSFVDCWINDTTFSSAMHNKNNVILAVGSESLVYGYRILMNWQYTMQQEKAEKKASKIEAAAASKALEEAKRRETIDDVVKEEEKEKVLKL